VPLFVRGPGVAPGSTAEKLILNTDFAPTIADLAGIEFPADGRSLAPLLRGEDPPWRSLILLEKFGGGEYKGVRTETHKYVEYDSGNKELYDLESDPYELESLHESADPSLLEDLKAKLEALKNCSGEGCLEAEDVP
jgi:N-acetylglucosamine-6-sulfatase